MADAEQRIKCLKCRRELGGGAATVEANFDFNKQGEPYSRCRPCKEKHNEINRAYYARNREALLACAKAYKEAHREEIRATARERIACERCGRMVCRDKMTHHQSTRLCEKRRPAP